MKTTAAALLKNIVMVMVVEAEQRKEKWGAWGGERTKSPVIQQLLRSNGWRMLWQLQVHAPIVMR